MSCATQTASPSTEFVQFFIDGGERPLNGFHTLEELMGLCGRGEVEQNLVVVDQDNGEQRSLMLV